MSWSGTSIVVTVPTGATTGPVVATTAGLSSAGVTFTVGGPISLPGPGLITTLAGNGIEGYSGDGGPATSAELTNFFGVAVDSAGNFYFADFYNNRIRAVVPLPTPVLSFAPIGLQTFGVAPFTVSASSASTGAITYTVLSGPATISGATVTLTGVGTVVLNASQAATANYEATGASTTFTVEPPPPSITGLEPATGAIGTAVTITGTNFGSTPGTLAFNGRPASVLSWSNKAITTTVPSGATTGPVTVSASSGVSNGAQFSVTVSTGCPITP